MRISVRDIGEFGLRHNVLVKSWYLVSSMASGTPAQFLNQVLEAKYLQTCP